MELKSSEKTASPPTTRIKQTAAPVHIHAPPSAIPPIAAERTGTIRKNLKYRIMAAPLAPVSSASNRLTERERACVSSQGTYEEVVVVDGADHEKVRVSGSDARARNLRAVVEVELVDPRR